MRTVILVAGELLEVLVLDFVVAGDRGPSAHRVVLPDRSVTRDDVLDRW